MDTALHEVALKMVAKGKGLLAADESSGTIKKRFDTEGIFDNPENHRKYRELLVTSKGIEKYISGVILYDETIRQKTDNGESFSEVLEEKGIIPGIKVDKGKIDMPGFPGEKVSEGLDGLKDRLAEYKKMGAKFAKWRAAIYIGQGTPTDGAILANAHALARYAALCQEAGIVPVVEPEVVMDGDHTIEKCSEATKRTLSEVFSQLEKMKVDIKGTILKTNMVLPGKESSQKASPKQIAQATLAVLDKVIPPGLPGVVFLSGGQTPEEATANLNEIAKNERPFELTFSFARAIQHYALKVWGGKDENVAKAQEEFITWAEKSSLASLGKL